MSLWLLIVLLGAIKLPIAALMLWLPLRRDEAMRAPESPGPSDDDGGSHALPAGPLDPRPPRPSGDHPRRQGPRRGAARAGRPAPSPRRDPHHSPVPRSPRRVRA